MPTTCKFELDRLNPVYSSGEYINGRILLKTEKAKRVNSVYVTLEGEARVQWSLSGKGEGTNYRFFGHQQYLYTRTNVFEDSEFRAGTHVYILTLRIPPDCPSSCKGPYGYIAYNISLVIDKPWSFDEVYRQPIGVIQTLDLNLYPEYGLPLKDENVKYFCRWPCTSGPICSTLVLPYCGFVPNQELLYYLEVDNQSPHYDVVGIEASLKQHYVFLSKKPLRRNYFTKTMAKKCIDDRTLRLTKRLYEGKLIVPVDLPRSTLNPNYIVFIHYTLQVKLRTGIMHYDTDISVPIVIGTEPLLQHQREHNITLITTQPTLRSRHLIEQQGADRQATDSDNETVQDLPDDEPPSYDSCLPPSFSFATLGSQQNLDNSWSLGRIVRNSEERQKLNIQMPAFPGYSTFIRSTQAANAFADSAIDLELNNSWGSLNSNNTLPSLESYDFTLNEADEEVLQEDIFQEFSNH